MCNEFYGEGNHREIYSMQFNEVCEVLKPHWVCVGSAAQVSSEEGCAQLWDLYIHAGKMMTKMDLVLKVPKYGFSAKRLILKYNLAPLTFYS